MKRLSFNQIPFSDIGFIIALTFFAWSPLLTSAYFFKAHDAQHSIFYVAEFAQTLQDGYLWPRWSPDFAFGYGYPLFNFYAPLAIYAASLIHLLGFNITVAVKTIYIMATLIAGLGMYGFVRRLFGPLAGIVAAVAYSYAPFHLVDIFVRSAYAEYVALAIVPFLFWAFTELIAHPRPKRITFAALSYGLLALTHHTSFFTFTPFLMVYILYLVIAKGVRHGPVMLIRTAIPPFIAGLLGGMFAAIYLIPALSETQHIKVEQWTSGSYSYLDHFVYLAQFISPMWGYGYAGPGLLDEFSYQLGLVLLTLNLIAGVVISTTHFPHRGTAIFFLCSTLVITLLMTPLAQPVWEVIPLATLVQFPWRLLGVTAFTMSIVAGALMRGLNLSALNLTHQGQVSLLSLILIAGSFSYTLPQYTEIPPWAETPLAVIYWDQKSIHDRVGMVSVTIEQPTTSPMEAQYLNHEPLMVAGIIDGQGSVETIHHGGSSDIVRVQAAEPITLQFYTYDFPGWYVLLDDTLISHRNEPPYGLITVDVPSGEHTLALKMGSTPPRTIGTVISLIALLILVGLWFIPPQWRVVSSIIP